MAVPTQNPRQTRHYTVHRLKSRPVSRCKAVGFCGCLGHKAGAPMNGMGDPGTHAPASGRHARDDVRAQEEAVTTLHLLAL